MLFLSLHCRHNGLIPIFCCYISAKDTNIEIFFCISDTIHTCEICNHSDIFLPCYNGIYGIDTCRKLCNFKLNTMLPLSGFLPLLHFRFRCYLHFRILLLLPSFLILIKVITIFFIILSSCLFCNILDSLCFDVLLVYIFITHLLEEFHLSLRNRLRAVIAGLSDLFSAF